MNDPNVVGGITVTGLVTGGHVIEDIKVSVPYQVAVYIPADKACISKDLWRGIGQRRLFQLEGGAGISFAPAAGNGGSEELKLEVDRLRQENLRLREEVSSLTSQLAEARQQSTSSQESLGNMQGQLEAILRAVGNLGQGGLRVVAGGSEVEPTRVIGGDSPVFIPSFTPASTTNIRTDSEVVENSALSSAARALRAARRGG